MKQFLRFGLFLAIFCLFGFSQILNGQILMYDNFNYPSGDPLTSHNWIQQQTTSTNPVLVNNGGLTYSGYICSGIGNAASLGTEGQDVFRGFTKQTQPGVTYLTCLVKVTSATTTGDFFISFKESATSPTNANYRGRIWVKVDASNNVAFGITKGNVTPNYTAASYSLNTTYLLVSKYTLVAGDPNDSVKLFINPVIGNPEPAPNVICPDIDVTSDLTGFGSVLLRQGTTGTSPTVIVDGVRVSKTWQHAFAASNISTLSDLKVDGITVAGFSPTVYAYNDTVPTGQTSVTLASTTTCWAATSNTTVASSLPGYSTVVVTAENGTATNTYTITHAYNYYTVAVSAAPAGSGTVTGGGVYPGNLPVTVTATANTGYQFYYWSDETGNPVSTNTSYTFTLVGNTTLVANFALLQYTITATADPIDGGTITGAGVVNYGTSVTLTATPNNGYIFENWTENGTILGTDPVLVLTNITSNHDIIGHFIQSSNTYTVTGTPNPPEGGTVTGSGNVPAGGSITLTVTENPQFAFDNWTENGVILGTDPSLTLTNVQSNHTILANFHSTVGVNNHSLQAVSVYPAISTGSFNVKSAKIIDEIQVSGMDGRVVFKENINADFTVLQTLYWKNGTYLVRIITSDMIYVKRVIVLN